MISLVCCPQGRDIVGSDLPRRVKGATCPGQARSPQIEEQQVRCKPRVPSVPVWEGMHGNKPVVKPGGGLIKREDIILEPVFGVVEDVP